MKTKITHVWSNRQGYLRATVTFDRDYEVKRIVLIKDEADVFARAVRRE